MKRIDEENALPSTCNKKQTSNLDAINIDDNDVCGIIKERRDTFDKKYDIGLISECEYDENSSGNEEESSGERTMRAMSYDKVYFWLLFII